jgi:uncharacterized surface protein with fasciclin (FAS1) repeats
MKTKFTILTVLICFLLTTASAQNAKTTDADYTPFSSLYKVDKQNASSLGDAKAVEGTMTALTGYEADATVEIPFFFDLTNVDDEWVDSLSITFPAGITPVSVSNDDVFFAFDSPDFDDEEFNGVDGQTVSWGDNDNNWGGIAAPNSYLFTVTVAVDAGVTGDQTVDFFASGDQFANPADLSGTVTLGEGLSVYGIVVNSDVHNTLETAINTAGLFVALANLDPTTLFAPTDAAFDELEAANPGIIADLLDDPETLANILLYHAANVEAFSGDLTDGQEIETLEANGFAVTVSIIDPSIFINGEEVVVPNLDASNGVVHAIDGVLLPPAVVSLPLDFELPVENYNIIGFGGAQNTSVIPNPDPSGINTSENVWQQTQDAANTAELFAGAVIDLNVPVDFSESGLVAMDVWTPQDVTEVTIRFEIANNDPASAGMQRTVNTTATNAWETLTFDFSDDANIGNEFVRCVVFFNLDLNNTDDTFYADNIRGTTLPTIFDIVESSDVHNTLETALVASGLDAVTSDPAVDLTLFAPTDAAFDALPDGVLTSLLDDPTGALANVLLYHVVAGTALSTDLSDGQEVLTLQGETVTVEIVDDVVTINGAEVIIADILADNGVVHVIDAVLVPELCTQFAGGPYTNFTTAFGGVPVAADGICPFNAITGFQSWASEAYLADNAVGGSTYTFGLSGGAIGAWDPDFIIIDALTGEIVASETEGNSITWTAPADGNYIWIIQEAGFCGNQTENDATDNGFPYMTCESDVTITDIVVASDVHNTLETAVIEAELAEVLAGEGPFTVFAPTDAAFDLLPDGLLDELLEDPTGDLATILTHHVANGTVYSTDLTDGQSIPTLQGENVTVGIDGEGVVTITSATGVIAEVTIANLIASNGVIHVIDAVLIPTLSSIDNLSSVDELKVFPNPTNNQFTLDIELNASERVTVDMINIVGQVVKSIDLGTRSAGLNREYIDVNDLSEGIYFMNLTVGGTQGTVKVQVVR